MSAERMARLREIGRRAAEIESELEPLYELDEPTVTQARNIDRLEAEAQELAAEATRLQAEIVADARAGRNGLQVERGHDAPMFNRGSLADPFDGGVAGSASELRGRAVAAAERIEAEISDEARNNVVEALEASSNDRDAGLAKLTLATMNPHYRTAFVRGLAGEEHLWSDAERAAVREVNEVRATLALGNTGAYGVPVHLDPTVTLTNDGGVNPLLDQAKVVQITTDTWNGLTSAGIVASYDAELSEVSDDTPTFAQPSIPTHKAQAWVEASIEVVADFVGLEAELAAMFADAKNRLEGEMFTNGTGSDQPTGFVTAILAADGAPDVVDPATPETFAAEDVFRLADALAPRWETNAVLMGTSGTRRTIARFYNPQGEEPDVFATVAMPYVANSFMRSAGDIDDSKTEDNPILAAGDFKAGFVIVQRVGMAIERVEHVFHTDSNRPKGARGFYAYWRSGSGIVAPGAIKLLNVATSGD